MPGAVARYDAGMPTEPPTPYTRATELVDAALGALEALWPADHVWHDYLPERVGVALDPPADDCCAGQLTATVTLLYPYVPGRFPAAAGQLPQRCLDPLPYAATIVVEHLTCEDVDDPDATQQDVDARRVLDAGWAILQAVECLCATWRDEDVDALVATHAPATGDGGCAGTQTTVVVALDPCCPAP